MSRTVEMRRQHNAWVAIVPWPALCETPLAMILGNSIDGRWIAPRTETTFTKNNPADSRDITGEFPASTFSREQGQSATDFYTQVKTISIDRAD